MCNAAQSNLYWFWSNYLSAPLAPCNSLLVTSFTNGKVVFSYSLTESLSHPAIYKYCGLVGIFQHLSLRPWRCGNQFFLLFCLCLHVSFFISIPTCSAITVDSVNSLPGVLNVAPSFPSWARCKWSSPICPNWRVMPNMPKWYVHFPPSSPYLSTLYIRLWLSMVLGIVDFTGIFAVQSIWHFSRHWPIVWHWQLVFSSTYRQVFSHNVWLRITRSCGVNVVVRKRKYYLTCGNCEMCTSSMRLSKLGANVFILITHVSVVRLLPCILIL